MVPFIALGVVSAWANLVRSTNPPTPVEIVFAAGLTILGFVIIVEKTKK